MTSREIIRRIIRHAGPPRLGFDFMAPEYQDIAHVRGIALVPARGEAYAQWGDYPELSQRSGFHGQTRLDAWGNVYGRLAGRTKGECVLGALQRDWALLADHAFPTLEAEPEKREPSGEGARDKYALVGLPTAVFSVLRDMRRIDNALMDTLEEPESVCDLLDRVTDLTVEIVRRLGARGVDGVMMADDWGTQKAPLISPRTFRELFKPYYRRIADACHAQDMDFMLHSCGFVLPLVPDMLDAGIDVLQFDQPEAAGSELWAREYGAKAAFYCPVDIQKVLPTGDRALIERTARAMADSFRACGGSLIAKDYPTLPDIGVKEEWAIWARDAIVERAWL